MSNMLEFILGAGIGAGAMLAKEKLSGNKVDELTRELDGLNTRYEVERRKRVAQDEELGKLRQELTNYRHKYDRQGDDVLDLEDDLGDEKRKNQRLSVELEQAKREIKEYELALAALKVELEALKNR